jgi:hypothetical protein
MEWNFADSMVDSLAILTLREMEDNGLEQHKHSCPNCQTIFWCDEDMCVTPSVANCGKATCVGQGSD